MPVGNFDPTRLVRIGILERKVNRLHSKASSLAQSKKCKDGESEKPPFTCTHRPPAWVHCFCCPLSRGAMRARGTARCRTHCCARCAKTLQTASITDTKVGFSITYVYIVHVDASKL